MQQSRRDDMPDALRGGGPRADGDVRKKGFDLQLSDPAARARRPVAHEHERTPRVSLRACGGGIVPQQIEHRVIADAARLRDRVVETRIHRARDVVDRAPAQRVMRVTQKDRPPRRVGKHSTGWTPGMGGESGPRLRIANQHPLGLRIPAFLSRARRERALQRPRVSVRVA